MSKHNELRDKICELCPDLMKLEFGCEVVLKGDAWWEYGIIISPKDLFNKTTGKVEKLIKGWDILGKDPTLEDVLRAFNESYNNLDHLPSVTFEGQFFYYDPETGDENLTGIFWNLGKPLSAQSSETVEAILEILK
jgi:hypothetical protein